MTILLNPPGLQTVTDIGATSDNDITLSGKLIANTIGLGGVTPGVTGYIDANPLNTSSVVSILFSKLFYSGTGSILASFQVDAHDASTAAISSGYGGIFFSGLNKATAIGNTTIGGSFIAGFSSNSVVLTFGFVNEFIGINPLVFPAYAVGGAHLGGAAYAWGVYVPTIGIPATIGSATRTWGILSEEDVQIFPDKKLMLNGSKYIKGGTYFVYNTATTDLDLYLDSVQLVNFDQDVVDFKVPVKVQGTAASVVHTITSAATGDDPIEEVLQFRGTTTNASKTIIGAITAAVNTTTFVHASIVARRTGGSAGTAEDGAAYVIYGAFTYDGTTVKIITSQQKTLVRENQAGWDANLEAGTGVINVTASGALNNNVTWHVTCRVYKVSS